jgi:glutaredoxin
MDTTHICSIIALALMGLLLVSSFVVRTSTGRKASKALGAVSAFLLFSAIAILAICNICCDGDGYQAKNHFTLLTMENCGFCKKIKKELPKIRAALPNVQFNVVNDDNPEFRKLSKELGAGGYPHGSINGKDIVGYRPADQYIAAVKKAMK